MANLSHRIRRLRCLVTANSQTEAFAIRQNLRDRWQDTLMPAFEGVFDEIASGDRVIRIPKIELHLKVSSEQQLLEDLPRLIQQQIEEQFQSLQPIDGEIIPATQSRATEQQITVKQNQFATLLHYLRTGSLPWHAAPGSVSEVATDFKELCRTERSQLIDYLSNQLETAPFYFRLLQLLSETESIALVNTLINAISDRLSPIARAAITDFIRFVFDPDRSHLTRYTQLHTLAAILPEYLGRSKQNLKPDFSSSAFSGIIDKGLSQTELDYKTFIPSMPANSNVLSQQSTLDRASPEIIDPDTLRSPLNPNTIHLFRDTENIDNLSNRRPDLSDRALISAPEIDSTGDKFPLFVNYAGLVLIHPFISSFFAATGVKETGSKAIAASQLVRAATLLHFLATGESELYEYELGFIKVLLGLEPEMPLLVEAGLAQEGDRKEAKTLLQSVINYWSALKNTSVDGLRSSFLQRSGLLRKSENGWSLQVEHQSFDMLLEHLPWSINIIKLSWMQYPLYTEWQTF
ncbi:contractile injection system tape measure protein [Pseudanabaena sp. PCC 6802]|uniref:contractile injection system tape measure protein n=1 Tax=Pseudanabaena sp. PCC 6802 TaxID=118173 RepID=UPI0012EA0BC3|nr:contractile injection system tape measure protein [Pseudanabaena sp. PCC 6802]